MSVTTTTTEAFELQPLPAFSTRRPSYTRTAAKNHSAVLSKDDGPSRSVEDEAFTPLASEPQPLSKLRMTLIIVQPSLINFLQSFASAIITVGLPSIARSIELPRSLYLWPSSVYGLTSGALLLIAGAIADIVGARIVELVGIFILGIFTLACGFSATGIQLVVFRALQGFGTALHLPASVALVAAAVPSGKARNIGFACLGLSQPLGFSTGLVVSGIMIERTGWRSAFYLCGGAILVAAVAAIWTLPKVKVEEQRDGSLTLLKKVYKEIDWVGGTIASAGFAILSYVLAIISADLSTIRTPTTASLLALSIVLLIAFPLWMHYRERVGKPALVPNSLWKNHAFATVCIMVVIVWGAINSMELFSSLYFQEVQNKSTITTSLYLLPNLVIGAVINLTVGLLVDRVSARWLCAIATFLAAIAPLMMALLDPNWSYWYLEFWAQALTPFSGDVLFTVGLIVVSDSFPEKTQALAGAVFNTAAQFGISLGIGLCQVVSLGVISKNGNTGPQASNNEAFDDVDKGVLLEGYRAAFWTMFALLTVTTVLAVVGLRKAGKVGLKRE